MKPTFFAMVVLLSAYPLTSVAKTLYQSHTSILKTAHTTLESLNASRIQDIRISVNRLDRRLKLKQCGVPLTGALSPGSKSQGRTTVNIRCEDTHTPWSIFISASVGVFKPIVVAKNAIHRGALIDQEDIELIEKNISSLRFGYLQSTQHVVGFIAKRNIQPGKILTKRLVQPPKIVHKGQQVTIIANNGQFSVRMMGKALMNGGIGQRIRVQNMRSKRIIEATITSSGQVKVTL